MQTAAPSSPVQLFARARLLTMRGDGPMAGVEPDGDSNSIAAVDGRIAAIGSDSELRRRFPQAEFIDLEGRLVTPGLIDCHTHIVYGGDRSAA